MRGTGAGEAVLIPVWCVVSLLLLLSSEGFTEVKQVDFVPTFPSTPAGEAARKLFFQLS